MRSLSQLVFGLLVVMLVAPAFSQGLLVVDQPDVRVRLPRPIIVPPRVPPRVSYKIKELTVQTRIEEQVARTQVSQSFVNTGSAQMEVSFVFPLPYDGAIDRMTFLVDGKEYEAKLLPAKEARKIYEGYIRRNQDPALLEWIGTGMFKTSVFPVPPGAQRTVSLRYSQLLRKDRQLTDYIFPLSTAKYTSSPIEKIKFEASIQSKSEIKSVYSPTHEVEVKRAGKNRATVKFEATKQVPTSDFRLFYDTAKGSIGASVISYRPDSSQDGYFLMLASPEFKAATAERPKKTAILVVDRSGSMSGKKMDQAKEALKFVINNLREDDLFNIIAYDSSVESFKPELQRCNQETREAALGFVEGIYAGGSTNIDGALLTAMKMIQDDSWPNFVVFLTDGLPTAGETDEAKIVEKVSQYNALKSRIISFGVGYDVNSRLLDRLSHTNYGQSEFVRPNEDIEAHVSRLYSKISSPVLSDVDVSFEFDQVAVEEGSPVGRIYPRRVRDLFEGEQLVVVGRYKKDGAAKIEITGRVGMDEKKFDFPASFTNISADEKYAFVAKLWAMRRIGEIIDQIDLHGQNEELVNELVALSTKYGIVTPYTSFLADDMAAPGDLADASKNISRTRRALERLTEVAGKAGFAQRGEKKVLREANQVAPAPAAASEGAANADAFGGVVVRDIETDQVLIKSGIQNIGNEAIYRRGKLSIAANAKDIDLEKDKSKIKEIKLFSDDYFKLITANTAAVNAVFAQQKIGEELLIKVHDQAYLIR